MLDRSRRIVAETGSSRVSSFWKRGSDSVVGCWDIGTLEKEDIINYNAQSMEEMSVAQEMRRHCFFCVK